MASFLDQRTGIETGTGHHANIVLASENAQTDKLPLIFDIGVAATGAEPAENWTWITEKIKLLRALKNRIFTSTLTEKCLNQFQHSESAARV